MKIKRERHAQVSLLNSSSSESARPIDHPAKSKRKSDVIKVEFVPETAEEFEVNENIAHLAEEERKWRADVRKRTGNLEPTRALAKDTKLALTGQLSMMKSLLAGRGREGAWLPFLKSHHMARATADRQVEKYRADQRKQDYMRESGGTPPPPTKEELEKLVRSLVAKCRFIKTASLIQGVLDMFAVELHRQMITPTHK